MRQYPFRSFRESLDYLIRLRLQLLIISMVNKDRSTTCSLPCFDISPAVSDHETRRKVDVRPGCSFKQHAWQRFTTVTIISIIVETHPELVNCQQILQNGVHRNDRALRLHSSGHIRLVADHHEPKSGFPQPGECLWDIVWDYKLGNIGGRMRKTILDYCAIDNAVAVEKHCPIHRTDSHFPVEVFRSGCDTMRCQMSA